MEKKTIGSFIAALRKASGMTQKQLADKLNVSDKSVSRWERDECAPDLSLIPVIAEIFGITSDELLKGERRNPEAEVKQEEKKTNKQLRRLMTEAKNKLHIHSLIAVTVAALGLICAMIFNLAFLRAYLGFCAGLAFYLVALVLEGIFLYSAHLSVTNTEFEGVPIEDFRKTLFATGTTSISAIVVMFAATLPLIVFPYDAYVGLNGDSWLLTGLLFGFAAALLWIVLSWGISAYLIRKGILPGSPAEDAKRKLRKKVLRVAAVVLLLTFFAHVTFNNLTSSSTFVSGIQFDNWEDFRTFMQTPMDYDGTSGTIAYGSPVGSDDRNMIYVMEDGSIIDPGEITEEEIRVPDGSAEGTVVCTYQWANNSVSQIEYGEAKNNLLPVTVYTNSALKQGYQIKSNISTAISLLYLLEIAILAANYMRKAKKLTHA